MNLPFHLFVDTAGAAEDSDRSLPEAVEALSGGLTEKETLLAFRKAVHREPTEPDYHFVLGEALVRMGRHAEALPALDEAIRLDPAQVVYRYAKGAALWEMGRAGEAVDDFREAARLRPRDFRARNALGAALVRAGSGSEAIGVMEAALRLTDPQAEASSNLAVALWEGGLQAAALDSFRTAADLSPSSADVWRNLALALGASARHAESIDILRHVIQLRPHSAEARLDLADALFAAGQHQEAAESYDLALELEPVCFRARPASREKRDAIMLERARAEIKAEVRGRDTLHPTVRAGLLAAGHGLLAVPRGVALAAWLGSIGATAYASWRIAPPYVTHHLLKDDVVEIARTPLDEAQARQRLQEAVRQRGLQDRILPGDVEIETGSQWRAIRFRYEVPVTLLPGWTRPLRFRIDVEEPLIEEKEPKFL